MKPRTRHLVLSALCSLAAVAVSAAPVRTPLGRNYFAEYDAAAKTLDVVSATPGREWRVNVAHGLASPADWGALATAAGPVVVYTSGPSVSYVLMRFQTGSTNAENSGEPLRGTIAPGQLLSVNWREGQYGAQATVVSLSGTTEYTTVYDINMWATSKLLSQTTRTVQAVREALPGGGLSFEVPVGFTARWDAGSKCMGIVSDTKRPVGLLLHAAEPGVELSSFADEFMKLIGPALGSPDLKQVLSDRVSVGSMPGLLRLGRGTMKGQSATFAFVFAAGPQATYVLVYGAPTVYYDQYAGLFYRLLASVRLA